MKALVTGAAGFIGSHLCERLLSQGCEVVGLDNFDPFYDRAIKEDNLAEAKKSPRFSFVEGDIRDADCVNRVCGENTFDIIVHLAARAGVRPSIQDPVGYMDVNINGTVTMLEAARSHGIKKFIFASSSSVYGNNVKVPFSEKDNVDYPISPYAATKKAGELICHTYSHLWGMDISCLRFFTVYGPRQRPDLAIHKFADLIRQGKPIPVFGDGSMRRDFTFISDIIDGVTASMRTCRGYNVYNLGESRPVRLDALIAAIEKALGKKAILHRLPEQPGDVRQTYADVSRAVRDLGYQPKTELEDGLMQFVKWLEKSKG
ncbi:MAG: SDR family NAD(P)-dependent oxidoreductase [Planctomycetaceae bacterium]|nr:SDR family NAD(P)-dependent oxidoreductase [Planctomycetaceae bacterium]